MTQRELNFADADRRPVLVRYIPSDIALFAMTPVTKLPRSVLMESRAQRVGATLDEMRAMRSYDLARELADETAILGLGPLDKTCRVPATRLNEATLDAAAKRMAAERAKDWQEFLAAKR
jgi:hypothetical protein